MKSFRLPVIAVLLAAVLLPLQAFAADGNLSVSGMTKAPEASQSAPLASQAKSKCRAKATKTMRTQYKAVLSKALKGKGPFRKAYKSSQYWYVNANALRDINKDGTPELLVNAGGYAANTAWYVYTIKSGKAKFLGKFGDGNTMVYSGKGKALYGLSAHMGEARVYRATISKGKLKTKRPVVDRAELKGFPSIRKYQKSNKCKKLKTYQGTRATGIDKAKVVK